MSPVRVTWSRTIGRARSLFSTGFAISGFLAASAALFAFRLDAAEGVSISVASVWASAVAPFLPALAAFLAMDVWSDELQSGRIELLLTAPVKEREYTLGKFLGVFKVKDHIITVCFKNKKIIVQVSSCTYIAEADSRTLLDQVIPLLIVFIGCSCKLILAVIYFVHFVIDFVNVILTIHIYDSDPFSSFKDAEASSQIIVAERLILPSGENIGRVWNFPNFFNADTVIFRRCRYTKTHDQCCQNQNRKKAPADCFHNSVLLFKSPSVSVSLC